MVAQEHMNKDWRREPFDNVRRFLHFLFGENPKREGLGIFIRLQEGRWTAEIRARLRLRGPELQMGEDGYMRVFGADPSGELVEGKPTTHAVNLFRSPG